VNGNEVLTRIYSFIGFAGENKLRRRFSATQPYNKHFSKNEGSYRM
jgi:hypothetical protein